MRRIKVRTKNGATNCFDAAQHAAGGLKVLLIHVAPQVADDVAERLVEQGTDRLPLPGLLGAVRLGVAGVRGAVTGGLTVLVPLRWLGRVFAVVGHFGLSHDFFRLWNFQVRILLTDPSPASGWPVESD